MKKDVTENGNRCDKEEQSYIYIMISRTYTRFGSVLRKIGNLRYNHASVALDRDLKELYSFARPQHNAPLLARLVHETTERYTLGKYNYIPVVIFRIPLSNERLQWVTSEIKKIEDDEDFIYNYPSVLTYPLLGGVSIEKSFSCIEFVMYILKGVGFQVKYPLCSYKPDELLDILTDYKIFSGNLLDYISDKKPKGSYFAPFTYDMLIKSADVIKKLAIRIFFSHQVN